MHRLIGTSLVALGAFQIGSLVGRGSEHPRNAVMGLVLGVLGGFLLAPLMVTRPVNSLRRRTATMEPHDLLSAVVGLVVGLLIAALLAFPLSLLPWWFGHLLPLVVAAIFGYLGAALMLDRRNDVAGIVGRRSGTMGLSQPTEGSDPIYVVDTSAIIDGRIADIVRAGFIHGRLLIPRFVLLELQHIADSPDQLRRNRGRRGLDVLHRLQKEEMTQVEIVDRDERRIPDVDSKLVFVARALGAPVVTNDYNLNRIAELEGVRVLNVNQLSNALKPIVLPGEEMSVHVIQEGKEYNQGLAYLDDGTMIVVENGKRYLHTDVAITVTRVLQTSAGRMIFAQPKSPANAP